MLTKVIRAIDAARSRRPEQLVVISPRHQVNVVWAVRPDLAEDNPIYVSDPASNSAWYVDRRSDDATSRLDSSPELLWFSWNEKPAADTIPWALAKRGYVITSSHRVDRQWWQARLTREDRCAVPDRLQIESDPSPVRWRDRHPT